MAWFRRPPIRELHREYPPPNEDRHTESLRRVLQAKMERDYGTGADARLMLRDAHPKMHGCVTARFTVRTDLPTEFAVGVLQPGRAYDALVRFSNQSARVSDDSRRDIRGAAIKLLDIDPPVLLQDEAARVTQDFVTISVDRFVTADVAQFDGLVRALVAGIGAQILYFIHHPRVLRNLLASLKHHENPLGMRYFSVAPYLLGERAVKYSLIPRTPAHAPPRRGANHLRESMAAQLQHGDATFDFAVQLQADPRRTPIEDAGVTWDERLTPFIPVAALHIPAQNFDTAERRDLGENLAFNPWHARAEHRPIGGINRARRVVYPALAEFRRVRNGTRPPRVDPKVPHGS